MIKTVKNIIHELTGQLHFENSTTEELEAVVNRYPYFGVAWFLLTLKMKNLKSDYEKNQLQKTALYFHNPFWLSYLMFEHEASEENDPETVLTKQIYQTAKENDDSIINVTESIPVEITEDINEQDEARDNKSQKNIENINGEHEQDRLSKMLEQHLSEFKKPLEDHENMPVQNSPYYTVDYFASQGIRLEGGQQNLDALGSKVKKFTEWLKEMKRISQQPTDLGTDSETEHAIETIAQTSNETKDIVTEAMAEVLIKQGKTEKAIQLYKKLSFLEPSKSIYFAAKIEELKDN